MNIWELFILFCKVNLLSFGGPSIGISIIEQELVTKKRILTQEELNKMFVTTNIVPGPVFIQLSVLIGYKFKKIIGVLICLLTSITIIPLLSIIFYFYVSKIIPTTKYNDFVILMSPVTILILFNFIIQTLKKIVKTSIKLIVVIIGLLLSILFLLIFKFSIFITLLCLAPLLFILGQFVFKIDTKEEI